MKRILAGLMIALIFSTVMNANALVEISGKCMEDCKDKELPYATCLDQCSAKSDSSVGISPVDKGTNIYADCIMPCQKKGNSPDFCRSICN
jgi:hypothetical protein